MSDESEFDEERIAALERIYRTPSMRDRRRRVRDALGLESGEDVLSVGTGPGFESRGLANEVGEEGRVHGVDTAAPMLAVARERCAGLGWATFEEGDAANLPVESETFDAAAAVQVYEYVTDLDTAFSELFRVLRPGGRAVVLTSDARSMIYHAADQARSDRITEAFGDHYVNPRLALTAKARLERANFAVTDQEPYVHFETDLSDDAVSAAFIPGIKGVVMDRGAIDEPDVEAWIEDIHTRADTGEYFFSYNQYLFRAEKPRETGGY